MEKIRGKIRRGRTASKAKSAAAFSGGDDFFLWSRERSGGKDGKASSGDGADGEAAS